MDIPPAAAVTSWEAMIWDADILVSFPKRMDILSPEMMAGDAFFSSSWHLTAVILPERKPFSLYFRP